MWRAGARPLFRCIEERRRPEPVVASRQPVVLWCEDTPAMGNAARVLSNAVRFRVCVVFLGSVMVSAVATCSPARSNHPAITTTLIYLTRAL